MPGESQGGSFLESIVIRLFLFLSLGISPALIIWVSGKLIFQEQENQKLELRRQSMMTQTSLLPKTSRTDAQLKALSKKLLSRGIATWSDQKIQRLTARLDKAYPGAFQWMFFDSRGGLRPLKGPMFLQGRRMWEGVTGYILKNAGVIIPGRNETIDVTNPLADPRLRAFQTGLGSFVLRRLEEGWKSSLPAQWMGKPCWITWDIASTKIRADGRLDNVLGGFFLIAYSDKLPEDFGFKRLIQDHRQTDKTMVHPMILIDLRDPAAVLLDPTLNPRRFPVQAIRSAYLQRREDCFIAGDWLVSSPPATNDQARRILALSNIGKIRSDTQLSLNRLKTFLALFLLFGVFLVSRVSLFLQGGISIRWRISLLFLLAIFLPVVGLLGIGGWVSTREETRLRNHIYETMRIGMEGLDIRYKDTPKLTERNLHARLMARLKDKHSIEALKETLLEMLSREELTHFFLSDTQGRIEFTTDKGIDSFLRRAIVNGIQENLKSLSNAPIAQTPEEKIVAEEMATFIQGADLNRKSLIGGVGALNYFCYRNTHLYFMPLMLNAFDGSRVVLLQMQASLLEHSFVEREFLDFTATDRHRARMGSLLDDADNIPLELSFFSVLSDGKHFPPQSPVWKILGSQFWQAYQLHTQLHGDVEIDGERFLYYISPLPAMTQQSYIPCYLASLKPIERRIAVIRRQMIILAILTAVVALILGLSLAGSLLGPIRNIDSAVQIIGEGNFEIRLPGMGKDELGRLCENINQMASGLLEKEKMQAYVSETVMEAVKEQTTIRAGEGEAIAATILFSDIRNFTPMTEKYPPDEIFAMLNSFFGRVEPIIRARQGRIDKFIGDAVMAVFSTGTPAEQAANAVLAGREIMDFLRKYNEERAQTGRFPISIGVGINSGTVLLGDVGGEKRKDLTIIGDPVNLAARLENESKTGKHTRIMLSEPTFRLVSGLIEAEEITGRQIKGKADPVKIYELIRLKPSSPEGSPG